ncbi:MAG: ribosomal protein S18-alanine N-acetyltransferase [Jannaschia sp.]
MRLSTRLAQLHAAVFDGPERWSEAAFSSSLDDPRCFFCIEDTEAALVGFALGRIAADEAELLTLAVAPEFQGCGWGRRLLEAFRLQARKRGAEVAFLEVSADNAVARALYGSAGWRTVGKRAGYYEGIDAIAMRRDL